MSLIALAFSLPFEVETAWLRLGPIQLTNVELLLGGLLGLAVVQWIGHRWANRKRALRGASWKHALQSWLTGRPNWLLGWFVAALFLSAMLAPEWPGNALKAAGRTTAGVLLALAVPDLVKSRRTFNGVVVALVIGGVVSAALGWLEVAQGTPLAWLRPFRPTPTVAGPFMRLTGSFGHANQAAMYAEVILPLLVALVWWVWRGRRRGWAVLLALVGLGYLQATLLT
ncbi:MAG: hypothetical protein AB1791_13190, partial [Chloroflexota bacterium]